MCLYDVLDGQQIKKGYQDEKEEKENLEFRQMKSPRNEIDVQQEENDTRIQENQPGRKSTQNSLITSEKGKVLSQNDFIIENQIAILKKIQKL